MVLPYSTPEDDWNVKAVRWEVESVLGSFATGVRFGHKTVRSKFVINNISSKNLGTDFLKKLRMKVA